MSRKAGAHMAQAFLVNRRSGSGRVAWWRGNYGGGEEGGSCCQFNRPQPSPWRPESTALVHFQQSAQRLANAVPTRVIKAPFDLRGGRRLICFFDPECNADHAPGTRQNPPYFGDPCVSRVSRTPGKLVFPARTWMISGSNDSSLFELLAPSESAQFPSRPWTTT
jgi:hypothetical protein